MNAPSPTASRPREGASIWPRAVVLLLICGALAAVGSSEALHSTLLRAVAAAGEIMAARPVLGAVVFVLLSAASALLAFFSSAVVVPVALYTWGKGVCFLLLWTGWTLGGMIAYWLGRTLGRPVLRWALPAATLARYEEQLSRHTSFRVVLLFQLALPSEVPGYLLGVVRYPFGRFLAAYILAELPYAVGTVYLGAGFLERHLLLVIALGALGALWMVIVLRVLQRRLRSEGPSAAD
jgi:uncharacterized membrane protein YdjX (TVP38/TMEM64 family)